MTICLAACGPVQSPAPTAKSAIVEAATQTATPTPPVPSPTTAPSRTPRPSSTTTPAATDLAAQTATATLPPVGEIQPIPHGFVYLGDRETLALGFNMDAGGAIGSLLYNGRELIDREDFGRYFQLSYYDGNQTYRARGKDPYGDWGWNPIQAGSKSYSGARVLEFRKFDGGVYIKALGKEWGKSNSDSDMIFETWAWQREGYFEIHTRSTHTGADRHAAGEQEYPAAYFATSLTRQFGYFGDAPFTGQPVEAIRQVGYPFCPPVTPTENWVAFGRDGQLGLILALPRQPYLSPSWRFCLISDVQPPVGYASPLAIFDNPKDAVREITYYLIPGPIDQGRGVVYDLLPHTTWNFDLNSAEGWHSTSQPVAVEGGILTTGLSPDEPLTSASALNIPGAIARSVSLSARAKDGDMEVCLFFITSADPTWDPAKSSCHALAGGDFQTHRFDLKGNAAWKDGVITQLGLRASHAGVIEIDAMKVDLDGLAWEFETEGDTEGWVAWNQLDPFTITLGALKTRSNGSDPYMGSPVVAIDANTFTTLSIRMAVTAGDSAKIYFITSADDTYDETKAIQFPVVGDGEFHTYTVDFSVVRGWRSTITQIRLDPSEMKASILIDFIRILKP